MTNTVTKEKYFESVGRRKTSTARVRLVKATKGQLSVNDEKPEVYFPTAEMRSRLEKVLVKIGEHGSFQITAKVSGGGKSGQTDALLMGLGRALVVFKPETKPALKAEKILTRDARAKERRKFGLKKARKSPQWSKR
ncbi:MAG: 30S ribosomal protein S9 [Candidatus Vogelbacteria bacterium CG10_big_fil_rev_8_21_14_0_10_49_38]|uniref:30S ribosomal protein S9 n=1 Tax=Candidatus Vogelbacteria bacterium CG10_big_fil_rev_8_21_14_0_10_49_38 TaxID=1975043 RepID=A0A2H0RH30_9BACT|nr:MAG: 30S ribosomal protein S9 [bacterium CG10_49_38]PIR45862.1 MAG: 30S ribosomal protein S9 [Candidatus Vogelbacteria bacterium CG10_big_fil_rev_8_21_14_0_10_49_38]